MSDINHTNIVPEVLLYNILSGVLKYIRQDLQENTVPEETILYSMLQDIGLLKHNYLEEAIALFKRNPPEDPRSVDVRLFFDAKRASEPTVHISLSSDDGGPTNSIGLDEDEYVWEREVPEGTEYTEIYGRSFETSLSVICTSSNHHEVLLMYYILRTSIIAVFDTFELEGFQNVRITGRELQIREDLVPNGIFSRGIMIRGFYEIRTRQFFNSKKLYDVMFENRIPYDSSE